ncbi:UDP-N-acetylmuramoyl-tripeptide--D-alanyl-D-alanine ligase [Lactococcus cremoris]|jgi:UDP-N-acetylmuramoyl-tripeptide--D-alanyl-D-alanine ligase|uniref:UDP-N-acetylmuramoyl-tripeptide--D-alanyl-D-alanine ligase n=1 Tax=Lactococcus lactis subsp. cremoris TaxID=1359 RepID=A0AAX4A6A3_LACLC|nr:UDP-N-acetylmuramoyl-tripeptide--D-alanyl-D-alanine ligase [Lactococcus cremoris]AGV72328.1 UDP-N-acetylmuramoyl-tripeptide-D-alanyl-D-alanine ligase MurF [Lactococcus cremoris subsp. cremoris KW2]KGH32789.1 UDP-N-acetylmuramoyl-tripeptide--D-alanyl-D-alanine ligase [Lactococcus cremoris]QSE63157.1 UDP-N-acetylmuramoyl-tripeptide--D-alanyl-D-alanine ligase [Lactococcus cremoris]WMX70992.1 UDP-N-acetylmuramoyl-tripeptide--D-alanyl-D-alanine ligase [Lactococcus cremoris]
MKLTIHEIAQVVGAKNDWSQLADLSVNKIEFDSRLIEKGDIFLPLKGARDGHDFIEIAFDNGAIISFSEKEVEQAHLLVDDNLAAFQTLAKYYLEKTKVPVIAVTGSNGKTTTKDMIAAVLSKKYKTYKTQGNHNNEIGLPYTILHMPEDTEKLVLEMGMDHPGDIDFLSQLAQPELALITLIGEAHLEFMGSRENIAKGKMGITAGLHGELIAPADPIINAFIPENQKISRFGLPGEDLFITKLIEHKERLTFETNFLDESITIPVPGKYNATNAMLAAYVGLHYGLTEAEIKKALKEVELTRNRTEWKKSKNGADLLSDVYNANPTAMRLILETFQAIPKNENGRKIAVLADMLELGPTAAQLHKEVLKSIDFTKIDKVYLYGEMMKNLADISTDKPVSYFTDLDLLTESLSADLKPADQVLFKGSNSMKLSEVVEKL